MNCCRGKSVEEAELLQRDAEPQFQLTSSNQKHALAFLKLSGPKSCSWGTYQSLKQVHSSLHLLKVHEFGNRDLRPVRARLVSGGIWAHFGHWQLLRPWKHLSLHFSCADKELILYRVTGIYYSFISIFHLGKKQTHHRFPLMAFSGWSDHGLIFPQER